MTTYISNNKCNRKRNSKSNDHRNSNDKNDNNLNCDRKRNKHYHGTIPSSTSTSLVKVLV